MGGRLMPPLTDAQLREYFTFLYGPDEPAPPSDASDDALEPFPLPFEDWGYTPEPDDQHPRGANNHGELCPDCGGEGDQGNEEDGASWVCDRCHGCGYYPPCEAHTPLPVPPNPNDLETWSEVIQSPTPESD
jgi:hypothetical protein